MTTTLTEKTFAQLLTAAGGANGTRVNAQGRIEAAVAPAFDYDPITLAARGLRFRGPVRTNLLTNSQLSALGVAEGTTPPTVGVATVDGEACSAVTFTPAMASGYPGSRWRPNSSAAAIVASTTYSTSSYVKLSRPLVGSEAINVYYTGSNGMGSTNISAVNSAPYAERFTRVVMGNATPGNTGTIYPVVHIVSTLASNLTVWICKGQVEVGAAASGYIPTNAGVVARTIDAVTISNVHQAPWFNMVEGTFLVDFDISTMPPASMNFGVFCVSNAANTSYLIASIASNGSVAVQAPAPITVASTAGLVPVGAIRRLVVSYKAGAKILLSVEGGAAIQSGPTFGGFAGGGHELRLGNFAGNPGPLDGHLQNFVYWPKAASATEIATLTPETETLTG